MPPARAALVAVLAVPSWTTGALAQPGAVSARLEAGPELDTNVGRVETIEGQPPPPPGVVPAVAARLAGSAAIAVALGGGHETVVGISAGARVFPDRRVNGESTAVVNAHATHRVTLGEQTQAGASADYYEAFEQGGHDPRDFRSFLPLLRFSTVLSAGGVISAGAGHRWFRFKPDRDLDFAAPLASASYRRIFVRAEGEVEWELVVGAAGELRRYSGPRLEYRCPPPPETCGAVAVGERRSDGYASAALEVVRVGIILAGAGYTMHFNHSNSFGEGLIRHVIHLRGTGTPGAGVFVSARVDLAVTTYRDPVLLGRDPSGLAYLSIEEENRSNARLEVTRDFGRRAQVFIRYGLGTTELGTRQVGFTRHTVFAGIAVGTDGS